MNGLSQEDNLIEFGKIDLNMDICSKNTKMMGVNVNKELSKWEIK